MLAGEPPFTGPTAQAIIAKRLTEPAPSVRRGAARRCRRRWTRRSGRRSRRSPADRFASAAEFAQALQARRPARRPRPPRGAAASPRAGCRAAAAPPAAPAASPSRPLALVLGFLIGARRAVRLAARRHGERSRSAGGRASLAVLPFENLGDSADAYFADGVTDEVRGKLDRAARPAGDRPQQLERSTGSTTKTPQQIGRELGVDYLLVGHGALGEGRRRHEPGAGEPRADRGRPTRRTPSGSSRSTRRSPTCSRCRPTSRAGWRRRSTWRSATRQQQVLGERPTGNLAAYDAYLKGEAAAAAGHATSDDPAAGDRLLRAGGGARLDFVPAWAQLSPRNSLLYSNGDARSPAIADAGARAAERALALDPERPEGYRALGSYYRLVPVTPTRALEQYTMGLALAPEQRRPAARTRSGRAEPGPWDAALEHLRRSRSSIPARDHGPPRWPRAALAPPVSTRHWPPRPALALEPSDLNVRRGQGDGLPRQGDLAVPGRRWRSRPTRWTAALVAYIATY